MEWMHGGGRDPKGRSLDDEIRIGKEDWMERQRVAQGGRIGLQSGQLVQPGPGRQGYRGNPQGNPLLGTKYTGTQHKGKIFGKNQERLDKLKEIIQESNSSYTKNITAHEALVKAGWKDGYQSIGTTQKIRPEVAKAMKKLQTNFEKMDNYVNNVMLAEDAFVKDFRNPQKHLAEKFGVSRATMDNWANGTPTGTWKGSKVWAENKKLFKALGKELSFNKYKSLPDGTPRLMWDYSEIIQNKLPSAFAERGEHLPHKFIMDSAHRHNTYAKHAGKSSQVRFIDKNYELLPRSEWKFIKGDKLYSMNPALDDVVYQGTTYKNNYLNHVDAANLYKNDFGDVYKAFDGLDVYMNTMVDGPDGKPIKLDTLLRRQAYDETGKKDFLRRRFAEIDHFDIDKKPFSDIRLIDRQTNVRAGILKRFDKYKNNPKLLNKTLTDIGYLNRDKDAAAFIKRMTKKATFPKTLRGGPTFGSGLGVLDDLVKSPGAKKALKIAPWLLGPIDFILEGGMALPALARGNPQMARRSTTPGVFGSYGGTMLEDIRKYNRGAYRYAKSHERCK